MQSKILQIKRLIWSRDHSVDLGQELLHLGIVARPVAADSRHDLFPPDDRAGIYRSTSFIQVKADVAQV
jgi:hypothetical protein